MNGTRSFQVGHGFMTAASKYIPVVLLLVGICCLIIYLLNTDTGRSSSLPDTELHQVDYKRPTVSDSDIESFREPIIPEKKHDQAERLDWVVQGTVKDTQGRPVSDARVSLKFCSSHARSETAMAPVYTDASGNYEAMVPATLVVGRYPRLDALPGTYIFGAIRARGFFPNNPHDSFLKGLPHPSLSRSPMRLDFVLNPGKCLSGRVLTSEGKPALDASLFVKAPGEDDWAHVHQVDERDGSFVIPLAREIPSTSLSFYEAGTCNLAAIGDGVSPTVSLYVDMMQDEVAPDLVLRRLGTIEGRVLSPSGLPMELVDVGAFAQEFKENPDDERLYYFPFTTDPQDDSKDCPGLLIDICTTDRNGNFRLQGLKPGRYHLMALVGEGMFPPPPEEDVFTIPCKTGDLNLELIHESYHLKIFARNRNGDLLPDVYLRYEYELMYKGEVLEVESTTSYMTMNDGSLFAGPVEPGPIRVVVSTDDGRSGEVRFVLSRGEYIKEVEVVVADSKGK